MRRTRACEEDAETTEKDVEGGGSFTEKTATGKKFTVAVGDSVGFSEKGGNDPGFAEREGGEVGFSERSSDEPGFQERSGDAKVFSDRSGADVSYDVVADADEESFSEQDAETLSFEKAEEWDWTEILKFCGEVSLADEIDYLRGVPVWEDDIGFSEDEKFLATILYGDNATPSDVLGLTGDTALGTTIRFLESINVPDDEFKKGIPVVLEDVPHGDDSVIVGKPVEADSVGFSDDKVTRGIPVIVDGPYFLYGQGGYGFGGYGGVDYLPLPTSHKVSATGVESESISLNDSSVEAYWLPIVISEDVVV